MSDDMRQEDLGMMRNPYTWAHKVLLPLRRSKTTPDVGLLVASQGPTVFLVNLFAVTNGEESLEDAEKLEYASFNAILDDGWYVD